jgi:uncharacterized protein YndB with AHSA1/START domain
MVCFAEIGESVTGKIAAWIKKRGKICKMRNPHYGKAVVDDETGIILASNVIYGEPEAIFHALTKSEEIERWWGAPDYYRMTQWKSNFRIGGDYSVILLAADGTEKPASGTFIEIDFPVKISYTRRFHWDFPILGQKPTTITYMIRRLDGCSRLTVRHEGFKGLVVAADQDVDHWEMVLGWLRRHFNGQSNF